MLLYSGSGATPTAFPIYDPSASSEIFVKDIQGLGPVQASIATQDFAFQDGAGFVSSRASTRNVVLTLGYKPRPMTGMDIQTLRRSLYPIFRPKGLVRMVFQSDYLRDVEIEGYVETHEPSIFSAEPEVQISILCLDPYFRSAIVDTYALEVPDNATYNSVGWTHVENTGDSPIGVTWDILLKDTMPDTADNLVIRLEQMTPQGEVLQNDLLNSKIKQVTGGVLRMNDRIMLNSTPGNRKLLIFRDIFIRNALGAVDNGINPINWPVIYPGETQRFRLVVNNNAVFRNLTPNLRVVLRYEGL